MFRNKALLTLAVTATAVILVTVMGGWPRVSGAPSPAQSIVGSWLVMPAGIPGRPPGTPNFQMYTSDGLFLMLSATPGYKGGQGVWVSTGARTVTVTYYGILSNANGDFTGTVKNRTALTLSATNDEISGLSKREQFDAEGNLVNSSNVTVHGTRIKIEAP